MSRYVGADEALPLIDQQREAVGLGEAEVGADLGQRIPQRTRLVRTAGPSRAHAASSIRPSTTRRRRSGRTDPGTTEAVVIKVWPAGSSATSVPVRAR